MAIATTSVWEMRTAGANTNGGFYKSDAGTTDYSQQDAAQLSLADLASNGAGTGISSATGGFTAAMVGNGFRIESTGGFTAGWYEITARTDTNNVTIDRSAGVSQTGGTGKVGGAVALFTGAMVETFTKTSTSANIMHVKAGTYTLTESITTSFDGLVQSPYRIIGYNTTRNDTPTEDNRPLIAAAAYAFIFDNYWNWFNLRFTTTDASGWRSDGGTLWVNCFAENTSASVNRAAFNGSAAWNEDTPARFFGCEAVSANGHAVYGKMAHVYGCYFHDSTYGLYLLSSGNGKTISFSVFDTCTYGVWAEVHGMFLLGNTFYNCTDGFFHKGYRYGHYVLNNIFSDCVDGIHSANSYMVLDYNNFYNNSANDINTTIGSQVFKGQHTTSLDPEFTDAANGDFSTGSNVQGTAFPVTFPGNGWTNARDQGAAQAAAGGGGTTETSYGFVG